MKVLLDTSVISEIRRPKGSSRVRARVDQLADADLFLSVITIGEIVKGISLLRAGKKKQSLEQWLLDVQQHYSMHILSVDSETAEIWGQITAKAQKRGHVIPVSDGLIAATAIRHGIHVMTRNTDHFAKAGALLVDPWENGQSRLCRKTRSGFKRPFFHLAASNFIDDKTNIACFVVFARRKNCSLSGRRRSFPTKPSMHGSLAETSHPPNATLSARKRALTALEFQAWAEVPPAIEWFANINNANTRRAYQNDVQEFLDLIGIAEPDELRIVTLAHVLE